MSSKDLLENVKKLREITGVGFKDCKLAIDESNGDLENGMSPIWSISIQILKNTPSPRRGSTLGAPPEVAPGVFFQKSFENEPYLAHPIFKIAIWLVFQNFTI